MADTFYREPTDHGDSFIWGPFILLNLRCGGRGGLSMELLNTGGALHLSAGYCGLNDGVVQGVVERTADGALSIAGITNGNWASIEVSVSGSVPTYQVTDIAGGTDELIIPASVQSAYDYFKGGYYLVATKRLIGIAFKTAGGTLGSIINCESGKHGFKPSNSQYPIYYRDILHRDSAGVETNKRIITKVIEIGDWNMDANATVNVVHGISDNTKIIGIRVVIRPDTVVGNSRYPIDWITAAQPSIPGSAYSFHSHPTTIDLERIAGGIFDNANFDSTGYNRGWIIVDYLE